MNNINQDTNSSKTSFWNLLSNNAFSIYIPKIQRNYAQGRIEPEPSQIRDNFLDELLLSLALKDELDINFIYGNVVTDSNHPNGIFYPIDGQQRLTTLFLLHWYFAMYTNSMNEKVKEYLKRFKYDTRPTTGLFCEKLIDNVVVDLKQLIKAGNRLDSYVKDYYWFFSDFDADPTISSMLVVLQTIHEKVANLQNDSDYNLDSFFEVLISKDCPINFLFLNIDDLGLTDEIYIKMNARGKPLTRFENFKAKLSNYFEKKKLTSFSSRLLNKINGKWSQFFWNKDFRYKESRTFDDQIMKLFRFVMYNEYIANVTLESTVQREDIRITLKQLEEENDFEFTNHLFKDGFKNVYKFKAQNEPVNENTFELIYKLLNVLSKYYLKNSNLKFIDENLFGKHYFDEMSFFRRLIRSVDDKELAYEDSVLMYAFLKYLASFSDDNDNFTDIDGLTKWIRYIYNLTRGQFYNQKDDYYRSIRAVSKMINSTNALDIEQYASSMTTNAYSQNFFYSLQAKEESIKATLMLQSKEWRKIIISAEKSYLGGQITSLLEFSGIISEYDVEISNYLKKHPKDFVLNNYRILENSQSFYNTFESYLNKLNEFFDKDGLKDKYEIDSIFRRALLTFGGLDSYLLISQGSILSFLNNTDRDYSFRRLLRGDNLKSDPKSTKKYMFKQLLDSIDLTKDVSSQLNQLINNFVDDENNKSNWKYYFIKMPELLCCLKANGYKYGKADLSGNYIFADDMRFINFRDENNILICEKKSTRSMNREYYTYVLYLIAKSKGYNVSYKYTYSEGREKYLEFESRENKNLRIVYAFEPICKQYAFIIKELDKQLEDYDEIDKALRFIEYYIKR